MDYSAINVDVRAKIGTKGIKVWVFMNGSWHDIGWSTYNGSSYLHVLSDEKPTWNPKLLRLDKVLYSNRNQLIWWLGEQEWLPTPTPNWVNPKEVVYLLSERKPFYHPTQQKIAKLILGESKMKEEVKTTPRPHAELIKKWAEDSSLKVYVWTLADRWEELTGPIWDKEIIYTVAKENPTEPPTKSYEITIKSSIVNVDLPIGLSEEELDERLHKHAKDNMNYYYNEVSK